ncbi:UDPglucose:Glycoprotein Glucosyltransferase [Leishmania braziliensis]|nr:UDPglucose:Glycoprotein Glucosyltransferase [Leishmania braziliensis]
MSSSMSGTGRGAMASPLRSFFALLRLLVLLSLGITSPTVHGKGIRATVEASWNETSFYQEGCEWAARSFGDEAFYSCLEALWSPPLKGNKGSVNPEEARDAMSARFRTQQQQYMTLVEVLFDLPETRGANRAFFEVEMAARVYSPAVEAHYALTDKALRETTSPQYFSEKAYSDEDKRGSGSSSSCGDPFAVVYTRTAPGALLQALRVETPSALKSAVDGVGKSHRGALVSVDEVTFARFDHRYMSSSPSATREVPAVVVLYGLLGSAATHALHRAAVELSSLADAASASTTSAPAYFWRHLPVSVSRLCAAAGVPGRSFAAATTSMWDSPLVVQGYGVTVDIKNMEYNVLDEKKAAQQRSKEESLAATSTGSLHDATNAAAAAKGAPETHGGRIVGGFRVARLKERYPGLAALLDEFATLLDEEVGSDDMKVSFDAWELQKIGLAATQYILDVKNHSRRLHVLEDMVMRFPTYATALSRIATQPGRLVEVRNTLSILHQTISPGQSALFVDGWRVEEEELSLFGVLHALHEEERLIRCIKTVLTTRAVPTKAEVSSEDVKREVRTVSWLPAMLEKVSGYVKQATRRAISTPENGADMEVAYAIPAKHTIWINNVETSPQLEGLSSELSIFTATDDITQIPRRNVLNYVFLWNPVSKTSLQMLSLLFRHRQEGLNARYGLAVVDLTWSPVVETGVQSDARDFKGEPTRSQAALQVFALVYHLAAMDENAVLAFLVELFQTSMKINTDTIPDAVVFRVCKKTAGRLLRTSVAELTSKADFLTYYHETQAVLRRFPVPQYPATFLNGVLLGDDLAGMSAALRRELALLRRWVSSRVLRDEMKDMYNAILKQRNAVDHLQPALVRTPVTMRWSDRPSTVAYVEGMPYVYSAAYAGDVPALTQLVTLPCELTTTMLQQVLTVLKSLEECGAVLEEDTVTHEVCRSLRLSLVSCPTATSLVHRHIETLQQQLTRSRAPKVTWHTALRRYVSHVVESVTSTSVDMNAVLCTETVLAALTESPLPDDLQTLVGVSSSTGENTPPQWDREQVHFWTAFEDAYKGSADNVALITNGRIVAMDTSFSTADVLTAARLVAPITKAALHVVMNVNFAEMISAADAGYTAEELDTNFFAGKAACLSSVFGDEISRHVAKESLSAPELMREENMVSSAKSWKRLQGVLFTVRNFRAEGVASDDAGEAEEESVTASGLQPLHRVTAVVDPSSHDAQVIVSLVHYLVQSQLQVHLTVLLNPSLDVKYPIRNFYQYVASPTLAFEETSGRVIVPPATFTQMPSLTLLTLGIDEPPSWTVFSQDAEVDLDNVMLSRLPRGTLFATAIYRMHSVLITGDATYVQTRVPTDGLPLSLHSSSRAGGAPEAAPRARSTDTQVMANKGGYYQLQANPGLWYLSIKEGPVAAAYCIEVIDGHAVLECAGGGKGLSLTNWSQGQHIPLLIDSFLGRYVSLRVGHTPNSAVTADLHRILQQIASGVEPTWPPFRSTHDTPPERPRKPTLNIFSVASGHLYERFLRMMMYSVHNTSSDKYGANTTRIKFWVIENFLSPQFKRYIPLLAEQLGFEVSFVTYRWPWWLPRQTEKQRKIWAYKILFLDVLFPLDIDRIIFVDADQTVLADLHELYNMNIGIKPVAMTPFCQKFKNKATASFRFWEQGFWKSHLGRKPYHISALFLIDLRRFRAMRAGDQYRGTYAQLAGDPNSLQNLDQDLPNYLQNIIPIFFLPEEWLWCETWCSETSKSRAKTIDLCNNPLTKVPKLENAKAIIPGWEELDNKLQGLSDSVLASL